MDSLISAPLEFLFFSSASSFSTANFSSSAEVSSNRRSGVGILKPGKLEPAEPCSTRNKFAAVSPGRTSMRDRLPAPSNDTTNKFLFFPIGLIRGWRGGATVPSRSNESTTCDSSLSINEDSFLDAQVGMIALVEERRLHLAILHLVEHHPQHRGQIVVLSFADACLRAERPDVVRCEFLPPQAGSVKPPAPFQSSIEHVIISVRRPGRGFVMPGKLGLGVEPVTHVDQHHGVKLE